MQLVCNSVMTHHDAQETVRENVRQLVEIERAARERDSKQDQIADRITRFSGSMAFVWLHVVLFALWIVGNLGIIPGVRAWDPYPFQLLTMAVSLEAILLSTFVLLSQNRAQETADSRQKLDLHMNLLTEEKSTIILQMLCKISDQLEQDENCKRSVDDEPHAFSKPTDLLEVVHLVQNENEIQIRERHLYGRHRAVGSVVTGDGSGTSADLERRG